MLFDEIVNSAYTHREYPALDSLSAEWRLSRPFEGLRVLVATPIFRNTLLEYRALLAGGAELVAGRAGGEGGTSMPCDAKIVDLRRESGIPLLTPAEVLAGESEGAFFDLILDCAGQFSACHPRHGFVELTRSGVQFFEKSSLPVYVADSGIVKRIETCLGTGEGYFRALEQLGFAEGAPEGGTPPATRLLVFGSGKVGSGIALQGVRRGCAVTVATDTQRAGGANDFSQVLSQNGVAVLDFRDYAAVSSAIAESRLVVTATGVKGALDHPQIVEALLASDAVLANMGVEDEYGPGVPAARVLAEKKPLNFILEEPTHLKYIDASLALHVALGELLVRGTQKETGPMDPPSELEQKIIMVTINQGAIGDELCGMMGL